MWRTSQIGNRLLAAVSQGNEGLALGSLQLCRRLEAFLFGWKNRNGLLNGSGVAPAVHAHQAFRCHNGCVAARTTRRRGVPTTDHITPISSAASHHIEFVDSEFTFSVHDPSIQLGCPWLVASPLIPVVLMVVVPQAQFEPGQPPAMQSSSSTVVPDRATRRNSLRHSRTAKIAGFAIATCTALQNTIIGCEKECHCTTGITKHDLEFA
jgi:hypothetical protein